MPSVPVPALSRLTIVMDASLVLDLFRRHGGLLEGHFRLTSGLHSAGYVQCARVLQHPEDAAALGRALGERVARLKPDLVLSPALGGVVAGHEVARAVGRRALFAERRDGRLVLRRGFRIARGERVLVVEDVVTTGGSTRETIAVAEAEGGAVVGAAAILDRAETPPGFDVPFEALVRWPLPVCEPERCPQCARGEPLTSPGSRSPGAPAS